MSTAYLLLLLGSAALSTLLFALWLKKRQGNIFCALLSLPLGMLLGTVLSKVFYCLLLFNSQLKRYGLDALLRTKPAEFSFFGACVGVVLAVCLAAKCFKLPIAKTLDAFAPCGALMVAAARALEYHLGLVGLGAVVQSESLQFFPVALWSDAAYGWFYAIFMLEAFFALLCSLISFLNSRKDAFAPGRVFCFTAFFLALPQVFCESLRSKCMKWGFVRIEQLLCGLLLLAIVVYACRLYQGKGKFTPALLLLPCLLMLVAVEFLLDKPIFGTYLPNWLCYAFMLVVLGLMAFIACLAFGRLKRNAA